MTILPTTLSRWFNDTLGDWPSEPGQGIGGRRDSYRCGPLLSHAGSKALGINGIPVRPDHAMSSKPRTVVSVRTPPIRPAAGTVIASGAMVALVPAACLGAYAGPHLVCFILGALPGA